MKFIYALNKEQRQELKLAGFEEIMSCKLNGEKAYVFENSPQKLATFSLENQNKFLITNVAYFV